MGFLVGLNGNKINGFSKLFNSVITGKRVPILKEIKKNNNKSFANLVGFSDDSG